MLIEKTYIIDRIENNKAICECVVSGVKIEINTKNLPADAKEGDAIRKDSENTYIIDLALSKQRLADLTARVDMLFKRKTL